MFISLNARRSFLQIEESPMFDEDPRSNARDVLLNWIRKKTLTSTQFNGLNLVDFTSSWRDGLAINALVHSIRPDLIDPVSVTRMNARERLEHAFRTAAQHMNIPRLIDADGSLLFQFDRTNPSPSCLAVDVSQPDEKSIVTYLAQFFRRFSDSVGRSLVVLRTAS